MKGRRTTPPRRPVDPPATPAEGAVRVCQLTVRLYDRQDGNGVDWRMIGETLFKAAFDVLDKLPDEQRQGMARRVHAGSYERLSASGADAYVPGTAGRNEAASDLTPMAGLTPSEPRH
jgi:hypothetical protein